MRGLTSTIVAAVVLAGLVGYIYVYEWNKPAGAAIERERAFTGVEAANIEELQIKSAGGEVARVVKAGDAWQLVEPVKAAADASELSSVTTNLSSIEVTRVVEENPSDLAQFGLNPPRVDVGFRLKGEKEFRHLLIGEKTPTGADLYAKRPNDNRVFLISSFLDTTFNRTPFDLRDKAILKFEREKVDGFELVSRGATLQFVRTGPDWRIVKPIAARADFATIESLVTRLTSAQMQRIADPDPKNLADYGLAKPAGVATIKTGSAQASLALGRTEGESAYAKDMSRPMVFTIEAGLATDLQKDLGEYRRKDVFDFRPFNANRVEVTRGQDSLVFEKTKDKDGKDIWRNAAGQTADTAKVEDMLTKLSNLRATAFSMDRPAGLVMPEATARVTFDDGKTETVQLGRAGADVFAARDDEPGFAKLEPAAYDEAVKALDALKQ